jgi:hypothetical protein
MKVICECGVEGKINCPPLFGETMSFAMGRFALRHGHPGATPPRTLKAVCACGVEREVGPGRFTGLDRLVKGMCDHEWFDHHAGCEGS